MDGDYEAEKAPLSAPMRPYGREAAHAAFAADPMYLEYLKEAAVVEAARRGRVIEIQEAEVTPVRRTQVDLDAALDADEEFQRLLRS